jgi:sugar/nucleoside kinase (ribokinase family)
MKTVVVVAHVNHDRIWTLAGALRSGARLSYSKREVRLGGGGFNAGSQLLHLGNVVRIVTNLRADDYGRSARETLSAMGFDISHVTMLDGETQFAEILLEPDGERTILTRSSARPPLTLPAQLVGDAAYVNAHFLDDNVLATLRSLPLVVSEFPIREATPRPADVVTCSKGDFSGETLPAVWDRARLIAGDRLHSLVMTDGPRPISIYDGATCQEIQPPVLATVRDTIGAGDCFTGIFINGLMNRLDLKSAAAEASQLTSAWLRRKNDI